MYVLHHNSVEISTLKYKILICLRIAMTDGPATFYYVYTCAFLYNCSCVGTYAVVFVRLFYGTYRATHMLVCVYVICMVKKAIENE